MPKEAAILCLLIPWLLVNGADFAWIYFYIHASIHPNPRTAVNITHSGWTGYVTMMFIFGFCWGIVNLIVFWAYFYPSFGFGSSHRNQNLSTMRMLFNMFIMVPVATVMILGPFFSPWVALPFAQRHEWNHGCDNFPVQVVLTAKSYNGPSYVPNTAQYFHGSAPAYTYDLFQESADAWSFNIRTIDSPELKQNMSDPFYPSISNITYNFVDNTVSGNCTSPFSNSSSMCIQGSFDPNNFLSFTLTDLRSNSTTHLRAVDKEWAFNDDAPSVLLKDDSGAEVIRTDVTKHCTQLKVCAGQQSMSGMTIPMGLILMRQIDYAVYCTTPDDN
jgi:hypothetical protein